LERKGNFKEFQLGYLQVYFVASRHGDTSGFLPYCLSTGSCLHMCTNDSSWWTGAEKIQYVEHIYLGFILISFSLIVKQVNYSW